ncbi:MAG: hypothetical protein KC466_09830, partial [Myxococcales bacterium]|nr:hypothetical protein [Myxococcales bacterium]
DNVAQNLAGGLFLASPTAVLTNVTVTANLSRGTGGAGNAGGILHVSGAAVLINCTVANNEASDGFSNEIVADHDAALGRVFFVRNTIVARSPSLGAACQGFVFSDGGNVLNDGACFQDGPLASDQVDVEPLLGLLTDAGGPTMTRPLSPESPAIDAGAPDRACPWRDQRGWLRVGPCDAGAFEYGAVAVSPASATLRDALADIASPRGDVGYAVARLMSAAGLL